MSITADLFSSRGDEGPGVGKGRWMHFSNEKKIHIVTFRILYHLQSECFILFIY